MPVGAPKYNLNAEVWTLKQAEKLFENALELVNTKQYDFVGEIASELKTKHKLLLSKCESNCFYNGKKKNIEPSLAIMNLKSNYGWTDRVVNKNENTNINSKELTPDEIKALNEELNRTY